MRLSLESLQVLDAIDRKGSFAAAAEDLNRVPSAVTYSVRQLEEGLGVEIFDRRGHRAVLTAAGRELLAEGRRLLQAASDLECRVQQVAKGWESELRIAVDTLIGIDRLYGLAAEFYQQASGTRLRLLHEVLGGTWDALASGRADLAVGAPGDAPAGRSYETRRLGPVEMVLVAAPFHPIVKEARPLTDEIIQRHRAVAIADTSRLLPPRTVGLLTGQDTLSVPSLEAKAAALVAGLGVGFVPRWIAEREALGGRLAVLEVAVPRPRGDLLVAWRPGQEGKALKWFVKRLEDPLAVAEAPVVTYRGRFAPSPTGPLHFGSLVAATASFLDARAAGGEWIVRMEDVDETRSVPGAGEAILGQLEAFGFEWDGDVVWQSRRKALYEAALERLRAQGLVYRCRCSRREVADSALTGVEGVIYPGTCRALGVDAATPGAERMRVGEGIVGFDDRVQGRIAQDVARAIGDFVLKRRDGLHAYQLAVVVDDADQAITHVVRGADLLQSTPRQILLQRKLGYPAVSYLHFPVATHESGEKLSKQTLAVAADAKSACALLRSALNFLGQPVAESADPRAILREAASRWDPGLVPRRTGLVAALNPTA